MYLGIGTALHNVSLPNKPLPVSFLFVCLFVNHPVAGPRDNHLGISLLLAAYIFHSGTFPGSEIPLIPQRCRAQLNSETI